MTLVALEEVEHLLACPRCGAPLTSVDAVFGCSSAACGASYPRAASGLPLLVDFDASILSADEVTRAATGVRLTGDNRWAIERLPPRLRGLWKPRNAIAAHQIDRLIEEVADARPLVLVVGGGTVGNGVERLYEDDRARVVAFDAYPSGVVQFVADAHRIPLASEAVDAVVVQAVLEHVLDPAQVVAEIHRVLRPDGLVYSETPFLQQVHAGPYDFTRFTRSGHRHLFRDFDELAAGAIDGAGTQLLWSLEHFIRALTRSELAGKVARGGLFWLRFFDRVVSRGASDFDDATAYFFLGRRSTRRLAPREIVDYYAGPQRV